MQPEPVHCCAGLAASPALPGGRGACPPLVCSHAVAACARRCCLPPGARPRCRLRVGQWMQEMLDYCAMQDRQRAQRRAAPRERVCLPLTWPTSGPDQCTKNHHPSAAACRAVRRGKCGVVGAAHGPGDAARARRAAHHPGQAQHNRYRGARVAASSSAAQPVHCSASPALAGSARGGRPAARRLEGGPASAPAAATRATRIAVKRMCRSCQHGQTSSSGSNATRKQLCCRPSGSAAVMFPGVAVTAADGQRLVTGLLLQAAAGSSAAAGASASAAAGASASAAAGASASAAAGASGSAAAGTTSAAAGAAGAAAASCAPAPAAGASGSAAGTSLAAVASASAGSAPACAVGCSATAASSAGASAAAASAAGAAAAPVSAAAACSPGSSMLLASASASACCCFAIASLTTCSADSGAAVPRSAVPQPPASHAGCPPSTLRLTAPPGGPAEQSSKLRLPCCGGQTRCAVRHAVQAGRQPAAQPWATRRAPHPPAPSAAAFAASGPPPAPAAGHQAQAHSRHGRGAVGARNHAAVCMPAARRGAVAALAAAATPLLLPPPPAPPPTWYFSASCPMSSLMLSCSRLELWRMARASSRSWASSGSTTSGAAAASAAAGAESMGQRGSTCCRR